MLCCETKLRSTRIFEDPIQRQKVQIRIFELNRRIYASTSNEMKMKMKMKYEVKGNVNAHIFDTIQKKVNYYFIFELFF